MTELSPTWMIVTIGSRKYAINTVYVQSIVELDNAMFKQPYYSSSFIKGTYNIHGASITILDGRKLVNEKTIDEFKMQYANKISSIRCQHEAWLDSVEWEILMGEKSENHVNTSDIELKNLIYSSNSEQTDIKVLRIIEKMKQPYEIIHKLADKAIAERKSGGRISEATSTINELHRQSENYIVKNLEKIIDIQASNLNELCIVVRLKGEIFGISIDSIEMITEQADKFSGYEKTRLSAGNVDIKGINYNILNLTKLSKIIR